MAMVRRRPVGGRDLCPNVHPSMRRWVTSGFDCRFIVHCGSIISTLACWREARGGRGAKPECNVWTFGWQARGPADRNVISRLSRLPARRWSVAEDRTKEQPRPLARLIVLLLLLCAVGRPIDVPQNGGHFSLASSTNGDRDCCAPLIPRCSCQPAHLGAPARQLRHLLHPIGCIVRWPTSSLSDSVPARQQRHLLHPIGCIVRWPTSSLSDSVPTLFPSQFITRLT
jgi:hypothetical protein